MNSNQISMDNRYDLLESISQRENGTMPPENEELVRVANVIRRAAESSTTDEGESCYGANNVADLNEQEKRAAEQFAKNNRCWIPISDIFSLGVPGPSGSESDTYISKDGYIYKSNNLLHCKDSIVVALEKFIFYNFIFPDSYYTFVGFTGFDGRSVFPVVKQQHIKNGIPAKQNEIDCYMAALGFEKLETGRFQNNEFILWDVLPKNALKDESGDIYIIDLELAKRA